MKRRSLLSASAIVLAAMFPLLVNADESKDTQALVAALAKSKLTLSEGLRQEWSRKRTSFRS